MTRNHTSGFTLIELIAVIVLISIVSLSANSYFSGISSVSTQTLKTELLHSLRLTQIRAMNRNGFCNRWLINEHRAQQVGLDETPENCSSVFPNTQKSNEYLENQDDTYVASLAKYNAVFALKVNSNLITPIIPYALDFDSIGRVTQCTNTRCEIIIYGSSTQTICIETEGYIHAC
ncbi:MULTISPECIES: Tfp pilus assembly protein FimT/FimU [unclassified Aliivibrio]|uniref:pilus assembly FimT family protein n=1 Tax=unclassified Aliivibrio TaxID=2645654 RepID=UPI00080E075B|nr:MULTISPECIES: type II secretion system protein [unclassified Aliivibrio]OCH16722.1 MSHA biogenesis protein MshC [Aliivibrio sp. 1S165]OCH19133.1 MSHA biogenesis protein MshC [Aliivibrio sp. 1S128]OCH32826.1 MSHA biogenesis protein MshC [Aliivibrio sp. 1S175]